MRRRQHSSVRPEVVAPSSAVSINYTSASGRTTNAEGRRAGDDWRESPEAGQQPGTTSRAAEALPSVSVSSAQEASTGTRKDIHSPRDIFFLTLNNAVSGSIGPPCPPT